MTATSTHPFVGNATPTLVELLRDRALNRSTQTSYVFLASGGTEEARLTFGELDWQARAIAALLQSFGAKGERVVLLYPPGLEYIAAFFGCLYAGAVAVPAYPPRNNQTLSRLQTIVGDSQATFALTTRQILSRGEAQLTSTPRLQALRWLTTDTLATGLAEQWEEPESDAATLAFLQYTSGSTASPKGVMVSHANLLHNEQMIRQAFGQTEQSIIVSWLPLYHDMGLIGTVLQPLYLAAQCILMSPMAFLQRPFRWLETISRYRATTSGGPNFAYDLCVRKTTMEERASLDLSSWSVAFNGAEPVRAATLNRFVEAFAPCGFRREAFSPCYGLAEATLLVSSKVGVGAPLVRTFETEALESHRALEVSGESDGAKALVGCGNALLEQKIVVVNPETLEAARAGEVGEIWVGGASVARGYWGREEETAHTFRAYLNGAGEEPYLRTGDLGFLHAGNLFVTGRLKDLLIIRGRNYYPQDIEATVAACHDALPPGCGAAFEIDASGEGRLVIVQEVKQPRYHDLESLIETIRQAVVEEHEVAAYAIALVKAGTIPKTSSGKIQRHACRRQYLQGELDTLSLWQESVGAKVDVEALSATGADVSADAIQEWLVTQLAARLGIPTSRIDVYQPLTRYGVDSLLSTELAHSIETSFGINCSIAMLLQEASLARLAELIASQTAGSSEHSPVISASREPVTESPLSHGQRALWFIYQLAPLSAAYNIAGAARIREELDAAALRRAIESLVAAHASLRTSFSTLSGEPVQRIGSGAEFSIREYDATGWSEDYLRERLTEEAERPFNLEAQRPLRINLYCISSHEHVLLLVVHHIVADLWSLGLLMQELGVAYAAAKAGGDAKPVAAALSYMDYVRWQRQMLDGHEGERLWSFWQKQLEGVQPVLELPTDHPRPPVQTYNGAAENIRLSARLTRRLKVLAEENRTTLFVVLLAAYQALLYRYTGQQDILVGTTVAGRKHAHFARVAGYFVNPLALRARPQGQQSFLDFLAQVRQTALDAFAHQDYPFALLVERLQPERTSSHTPLFNVMFNWQRALSPGAQALPAFALGEEGVCVDLHGLTLESVALTRRTAQFELVLMMAEADDELAASFQYNTDLFEQATIRRMTGHFRCLLESVAAAPTTRLADLQILIEAEQNQLLTGWNETTLPYPQEKGLHHLFERQVEQTPEVVAVIFGEYRLTYRELNERANQLASDLRAAGVRPETLVAIYLERSTEMLVTMLAVLKAGGAYVPLDRDYPVERLTFILEDAAIKLLLTQQPLLGRLPQQDGLAVVCVDTEWRARAALSQTANQPSEREKTTNSRPFAPESLAYVIYTSGSTGKPKGVAVTHRSVVAFISWMHTIFTEAQLASVLASTSICFDISVFELFVPLTCGGKVIIAEHALQLPSLPAAAEVSLLNTVPSAMTELMRMGGLPASIKTVTLGGEAVTESLAHLIYGEDTVAQVWNLYGPTEDTVYSMSALVPRADEHGEIRVTIGRPAGNTQAYVLDGDLHVTPVGVIGELYLSGDGLARGYLQRPDLTAEKFIPNPFSRTPGSRMYRTGDLVRYLPGGEVEFLARADYQVKIRGYRIELGEIEAVLRTHPRVREAVAVVHLSSTGDKRLAAYVVYQDETESSGDEPRDAGQGSFNQLRRYLKERLPEYMIPATFVPLAELPLTPNGKVNRRALPGPAEERPFLQEDFTAPRTPLEQSLANIWSQVLAVKQVGVHDNFFELGGHSLLATQLISRVREAFRVDIPLHRLFELSTVASMAETIERMQIEQADDEKLAQILAELEHISDTEAEAFMAQNSTRTGASHE
jgi:amino acid adenylation domain-containing protein